MAFFRTVSLSEQIPAVTGNGVVLRAPQMSDCAEWAALREASRDFLTPWEPTWPADDLTRPSFRRRVRSRSEEHTSELQSRGHLVCRLLLEKKKKNKESKFD